MKSSVIVENCSCHYLKSMIRKTILPYEWCKTIYIAYFLLIVYKNFNIEILIGYISTLLIGCWKGTNHPEANSWHSSSLLPRVTQEMLEEELLHLSEGHSTI